MEDIDADPSRSQAPSGTMTPGVAAPPDVGENNAQTEHLELKDGGGELQRPDAEEGQGTSDVARLDHEVTRNEAAASCAAGRGVEVPDGGWGWVVAFASAVVMLLIPVMGPCFGILFSAYLLREGTSSTVSSWIFSVQTLVFNISFLFTKALSEEFGWRAVGIGGSFLAFLGFAMSSFTPNPEFLFFSFSVICGIGGGIATSVSFVVVPNYFSRRRGAATAIMTGGAGLGQIIVPPLVALLQDKYGDRGATLIFGGIMLHACVAAATFHPVRWHMIQRQDQTIPAPTTPATNATSAKSSQPTILLRVAKSVVSDLSILRSRRACIISVACTLVLINGLYFLMMLPFAFQDMGFSIDDSAWCMSAMAVASLIVRFLCSFLSDFSFFSVRVFYLIGCTIMGITAAVFPLLRSLEWLTVNMAVHGVGLGANMGTYTLMMIDVMGLPSLAPLLGTCAFFNGIGLFVVGPLIGLIRDASQSYPVSIWVLSSLGMSGPLLWTLMGRATTYDKQRREEGRLDL